jgi:hypothetical protein
VTLDEVQGRSDAAPPTRLPALSSLLCDAACLAFAGWTLLCHAAVWLGGRTIHLVLAAAAALIMLAGALAWARSRGRLGAWRSLFEDPPLLCQESLPGPGAAWLAGVWPRAIALALGAGFALVFWNRRDVRELSALALGYFVLAYLLVVRSPPQPNDPPERGAHEWLLAGIALAHGALTLSAHVPDPDDALYVNMAISLVDFADRPLLSSDTVHGIVGAPFKLPVYRLQSLELLSGALDYVTGLPSIYGYHLVLPAIAGCMVPLALARLFRLLDPRRWIWAVLVTVLLLVFDAGAGPGSYFRFGFVRLFQGKAVFASALVPLIAAYGIRFGLRPSLGGFVLLVAGQIAALGMTVTALWAAPIVAALGVVCALRPRLSSLRTLGLALASTGYVLGWGLFLLWQARAPSPAAAAGPSSDRAPERDLVMDAFHMVLGHGRHLALSLAVVLIAWPLCRTALGRRFAVVFPLGCFMFHGNPWLSDLVSGVTTTSIYWRVLWLLPVPVLAALALISPLEVGSRSLARRVASFVVFACVAGGSVFYLSLHRPALELAKLDLPRLKVDAPAYRVARELMRHVPPRSEVLAPLKVSLILPMLNGNVYPLSSKPRYVQVSSEDRLLRKKLVSMVERNGPSFEPQWFAERLDEYHVTAVVFALGRNRRVVRDALKSLRFHRVAALDQHEIWTR